MRYSQAYVQHRTQGPFPGRVDTGEQRREALRAVEEWQQELVRLSKETQ